MTDDVAKRIQLQAFENLKSKHALDLVDKELQLSAKFEQEKLRALAEQAEFANELFEKMFAKLDLLIEFIAKHNSAELTNEILELIAERQEQRMEDTLSVEVAPDPTVGGTLTLRNGNVVAPVLGRSAMSSGAIASIAASSAGQILRRSNSKLDWSAVNTKDHVGKLNRFKHISERIQRLLEVAKK